ncbi:MAG: hypothetical protein B7X04_00155 [Parcubacteria group bacterium 21-54-25]|nr:MAG: hypothetical protein B7X04_00155 [Parcubacteria group bacterium 21-54-25]HQU07530.1 SIMPL domain-containing protein [Candidatus Paceibacterota bacterium]
MSDMPNNVPGEHSVRWLRIAGVVALALLSLFLLVETVAVIDSLGRPSNAAADTITVSGEGKAAAAPDTATISYTVTKTAPQVSEAMAAATKVENTALAFLTQQGVADKNVQTAGYSINPHYEYRPCVSGVCSPAKVTGYDVSQTVSVKINDLAKVGTVIGGLGGVGVTNLSGPNFVVNDPTSLEDQARAEAITKAKAQAETIAKELGVRLVRIVNYSETPNNPRPIRYSVAASATGAEVSTPSVPIGENEYTVNVSITYEIR